MTEICTTCGYEAEERFDGHSCMTVLQDRVESLELKAKTLDWLSNHEVEIKSSVDELGIEECRLIYWKDGEPRTVIEEGLVEAVQEAISEEVEETGEGLWA